MSETFTKEVSNIIISLLRMHLVSTFETNFWKKAIYKILIGVVAKQISITVSNNLEEGRHQASLPRIRHQAILGLMVNEVMEHHAHHDFLIKQTGLLAR